MSAPIAPASPHAASRGGKYLTFFLADEEYGVEILKVQEIIGVQPITRVPRTPSSVRGVINLRGKVIPIMDLRERLGIPGGEITAAAAAVRCTIVVQVAAPQGRAVVMGLLVDRVSEVAAVAEDDVEDAPSFGPGVRTEYLLGIARTRVPDGARDGQGAAGGGRVRLLLDLDRVLAPHEVAQLSASSDAG